MADQFFLNKNPIKKIIINTSSSIYKDERRKQNHPIELFIVTNFILMKLTRFHYSELGYNLCYKETSAVTKFAIMRSAHWSIQGQGVQVKCRIRKMVACGAQNNNVPVSSLENKCLYPTYIHVPMHTGTALCTQIYTQSQRQHKACFLWGQHYS